MERFDLQSEDTLLIRNSYRTHRSNNYNDCSSGISVPTVHVCGQQFANKHINGFNIRIKRYLLMCMVTLAILLLLYIPVYHHIMPSRIGENTKSASLDVVGMHCLALAVRVLRLS